MYTKPTLRERLKKKITAGSKGGKPGQWSARKAQMLVHEYEKAGGGYYGRKTKAQSSLVRWIEQDWHTKSGEPSLKTGERYLPDAALSALSAAEYAATTLKKKKDLKAGKQFSKQPKKIAKKTSKYRK